MSNAQSKPGMNPQAALSMRARGLVMGLAVEFLLGMAVNLIGLPEETTGFAKTATTIILGLHVLIGIGLLVGAIFMVRIALTGVPELGGMAWAGLALIVITFLAGVLTLVMHSDWWSYLMAVGFIAAFLLYGFMFVRGMSMAAGGRPQSR